MANESNTVDIEPNVINWIFSLGSIEEVKIIKKHGWHQAKVIGRMQLLPELRNRFVFRVRGADQKLVWQVDAVEGIKTSLDPLFGLTGSLNECLDQAEILNGSATGSLFSCSGLLFNRTMDEKTCWKDLTSVILLKSIKPISGRFFRKLLPCEQPLSDRAVLTSNNLPVECNHRLVSDQWSLKDFCWICS